MASTKRKDDTFPGRGRRLTRVRCAEVFQTLAEHIVPRAELTWETPFDLLVAVVLSAQATDRSVNQVTERLWCSCRTPADYMALGEARLADAIHSIGLFRNKARSIIGICEALMERFQGDVPRTRSELESLPGVGRKSANVVLNVAFRQPVMPVDTHVFRVSNRIGLVRAATPLATEEQLMRCIPQRFLVDAHHFLLLHGRYTCTARKPACPSCPVMSLCTYRLKTPPAEEAAT